MNDTATALESARIARDRAREDVADLQRKHAAAVTLTTDAEDTYKRDRTDAHWRSVQAARATRDRLALDLAAVHDEHAARERSFVDADLAHARHVSRTLDPHRVFAESTPDDFGALLVAYAAAFEAIARICERARSANAGADVVHAANHDRIERERAEWHAAYDHLPIEQQPRYRDPSDGLAREVTAIEIGESINHALATLRAHAGIPAAIESWFSHDQIPLLLRAAFADSIDRNHFREIVQRVLAPAQDSKAA
jgi:hypothetical protein